MTLTTFLSSRRRSGQAAAALTLAGALALWSIPAGAQVPAERLSDPAVKALIEQVDVARDKFEGNLDDSLKGSTIRSATGETKVSAFLQDLQDNTKKLKDRFNGDYAASAEAEVLLKQGTAIEAFMQRSPGVTKGRSEWDHLAATLKSLAAVYATTFPLPDGAAVRRMSDKETAATAAALATSASEYKKQIDKDKALAKPDKELAKKSADDLSKAAKTLQSRLNDSKPAAAEMRSVVDQVSRLDAFTMAHPSTLAASSWMGVTASLAKLQQSFGMKP